MPRTPPRLMTIVTPPPGVSSTAMLAAHRLDESARDGEAEADAGAVRPVAQALERPEHVFRSVGRDPRAAVDHLEVDALLRRRTPRRARAASGG